MVSVYPPNIGLASDIINENQRRMKEHKIMYPEYYTKPDYVKGPPVGVPGKPDLFRGSRGAMTQRMLERIASRQEAGLSAEEILCDIMQDTKQNMELRFRAASKVADLVYPKAASVEIDVDNKQLSLEEIDSKLIGLLQKNYVKRVEKVVESVIEEAVLVEGVNDTSIEENEDIAECHTEKELIKVMTSHDDTPSLNLSSVDCPVGTIASSMHSLPSIDSLESVEWEPSPEVESFQISNNWAYSVGEE